MFSDHLKKFDELPSRALFGVLAGLVFIGLLAALVLVVDGQVEKAQSREAQAKSAQMAMTDCSENYSGAARSHCIEQVNAAPYSTFAPEPGLKAVTEVAAQNDARASASQVQGFMPTRFSNRQ